MGLDSFASRSPGSIALTPKDKAVFKSLDLPLCEWIGDGSFRGKVYILLVYEVCDTSLSQEWIPPEELGRMADAFAACDVEAVAQKEDCRPEEVRALGLLFGVCAERGLGLIGWF